MKVFVITEGRRIQHSAETHNKVFKDGKVFHKYEFKHGRHAGQLHVTHDPRTSTSEVNWGLLDNKGTLRHVPFGVKSNVGRTLKTLKLIRAAVVHHAKTVRPKEIKYTTHPSGHGLDRRARVYGRVLQGPLSKRGYRHDAESMSGPAGSYKAHTWSRP